jgi:hypothetical protein
MTFQNGYRPLSRSVRTWIAVAALVASCASLSAVLGVFDSAGSRPWVAAAHADVVAHCEAMRQPTQRHACLKATAQRAATTRVAAR